MTSGPQEPGGSARGDEPEPSEETLRRLEERLDRASEVAERLIVEAAARVAQDPEAGQPPPEEPEAGPPPPEDPEAGQPPPEEPEAGPPPPEDPEAGQPPPEEPEAGPPPPEDPEAGQPPPEEPEAGPPPPEDPEAGQPPPEEPEAGPPPPEDPEAGQPPPEEPGPEPEAATPPPAGWQRRQDEPTGSSGRGELDLLLQILGAVRDRIPPELQHRLAQALREVLLAIRALIDWYLERTERRRPESVQVEDIPII